MIAIYFVGCSGSGKTALAEYVEKKYGVKRLPSASRKVVSEMGLTTNDYATLVADRDRYFDFQSRVNQCQYDMEITCRGRGESYVSDRSFDHLVYAAHYGTQADKIAQSGTMYAYMMALMQKDYPYVIFHVRPTRHVFQAAVRDGDRPLFLNWDRMNQFDGAVKFILEVYGLQHTEITVPGLIDRYEIIDRVLQPLGVK